MKKSMRRKALGSIDYELKKWTLHEVDFQIEFKKKTKAIYQIVEWAVQLTEMARGKHHIGDFMPPDELEKFMKTYSVINK